MRSPNKEISGKLIGGFLAEGEGFEPSTPYKRGKHLAGARTRPLCDPSVCGITVYILGDNSGFDKWQLLSVFVFLLMFYGIFSCY